MTPPSLPPLAPFPGEQVIGLSKVCEVCGATFDTRDLDLVFHHDTNPHEPGAIVSGAAKSAAN